MKTKRIVLGCCVLLVLVSALCQFISKEQVKAKYEEKIEFTTYSNEALAQKVLPTVVRIEVSVYVINPFTEEVQKMRAVGSGVFINENGYILTNAHVVDKAIIDVSVTTYSGKKYKGIVLARDSSKDLALVKITSTEKFPYAKFSASDKLKVGQEVFAVGHPIDLGWTFTNGIVTALHRNFSDINKYNLIQTNAVVNPGNSGGPLFNRSGHIVGINFLIASPRGIPAFTGQSFAIPSKTCLAFLGKHKSLIK